MPDKDHLYLEGDKYDTLSLKKEQSKKRVSESLKST
jgi:hypothetical protein